MVTQPLKVLVYDIETAPGEVFAFGPKIRFAPFSQWKKMPFMMQWGAAWLHGGRVMSDTVTPEEVRNRDDSRVVDSIAELIRSADIVLAHNGDQFDIPWVRGRTWIHDLEPLGPVASIDTRKLSARDFKMTHNNLDALLAQKLNTRKIKTDFSWWTDIILTAEAGDDDGCEKALRRMLRYCKKDTTALRDLFLTMIPYVGRLPRMVDTTEMYVCPYCGSDEVQKRGIKRTQAYNYQQYQCQNTQCMRYSNERTHDRTQRSERRPT